MNKTTVGAVIVGLGLAFGLAAEAWATTGLVSQWSGPRRYLLQAELQPPMLLQFNAEQNLESRVAHVRLNVVTSCAPAKALGKTGWQVDCTLADVALQATPVNADKSVDLQSILTEWDSRLTGSKVQLTVTTDGRVKDVDLEGGTAAHNQRTSDIHETMRLVLARAFAGLDLGLPKGGDDKGKGEWKQDNLLALAFPSSQGTLGGVQVVHKVGPVNGDVVEIDSEGKGTISSGETVSVGGQEAPAYTYAMTYKGTAHFDTKTGTLVDRDYHTEGLPTVSSNVHETGSNLSYLQDVHVELIPDGAVVPVLPESGVMAD